MNSEDSKTFIVVRRTGKAIQIRRNGYKRKSVKLITITDVPSQLDTVAPLLQNDVERHKWQVERRKILQAEKNTRIKSLIDDGLDNQLLGVYEALLTLQARDPTGKNPDNQNMAINIWLIWGLIRQVVSSKSAWHVQDKDARALLLNDESNTKNVLRTLAARGLKIHP
ncbi:MAG: hypothetical protein GYB33_09585 [Gammaproteobacteria bacterium]|nr:hypothetical protein [Gammaproteobacteria bacterium]